MYTWLSDTKYNNKYISLYICKESNKIQMKIWPNLEDLDESEYTVNDIDTVNDALKIGQLVIELGA